MLHMNETSNSLTTRRDFIKTTGRLAAVSALAGVTLPHVHAAGSELIQVALIGCGGRGTGAAANALTAKGGPLKLVAMADVFEDRLSGSYDTITRQCGDGVAVPPERRFIGFDAYQKAMDCLKPGDIAIFTTPLAFRWVHFAYAIAKGLNVFMEKPLTADGPTSRRMLKLAEAATAKNLKVGVGLMSRHHRPMEELHQRIENGEIGDIILMRGYRMHGPAASCFSTKWPGDPSELLWQIRHFHSFLWASGGLYNDFYIHHIDHLCWMKNAWPVKAQALGGAGAAEGAVDAANLLKPMLARGELRCVGATTLDEYRKHIEKDAALERRFQPVMVGEPSVADAIAILRGLKERYEVHHGVRIQDSALIAAATLSHRYIADRFLPDKAIDLIDEADRRVMQLEIELTSLRKEKDEASKERRSAIESELSELKQRSEGMKAQW